MKFNQTIYETSKVRLVVNYSWITDEIALATEIKLQFFAFEKWSYQEIFNETLEIGNIRLLYKHLDGISILKDSSLIESWSFIEITNESLVKFFSETESIDENIVWHVLWKISTEDILKSLSILQLENLSASHKQQSYKNELKKLKFILHLEKKWILVSKIWFFPYIQEYKAGQPEKILQNWLENNLWVFWVEYEKMEWFRKISKSSEWDMIMKSIDWYLDLIELKKSKYDLLRYDTSHNCYYKSSHLSTVIGQSMYYIKSLQEYSEILSKEEDVKILRPRVKIIAWRSNEFNEQQFNTLRMINSHLVDISVITYDEILKYWNKIISHYE